MALIQCPECGAKISSNAKNCVCCGCEIFCCPECNKVYLQKPNVCETCGYVFGKTEKHSVKTDLDKQYDNLGRQMERDKQKLKKFKWFFRITQILSLVIIAVCAALIVEWAKKDGYQKFVAAETLLWNIKWLIPMFIVTDFLCSYSIDSANMFIKLGRIKYLIMNNFDFQTFLKSGAANGLESYTDAITETAYYCANPRKKIWIWLPNILQLVFLIVTSAFASVWIIDNISYNITAYTTGMGNGIKFEFGSTAFICGVVFFVLTFFCDFIVYLNSKHFSDWVKNNK